MRLLILGGGGIARGIADLFLREGWIVRVVEHNECDVVDPEQADAAIRNCSTRWDLVVCTAGVESSTLETIMTNLYGSINVARSCSRRYIPCVLFASVAGLYGKPGHLAYSASKAGVISVVQSLGFDNPIWAVSPGRVNTPMRQKHYPRDTPGSRLTVEEVAEVVYDISEGAYAPGTNVIVRIRGNDAHGRTVTVAPEVSSWKHTLQVGQPVTI